jgi:hypothetical protein
MSLETILIILLVLWLLGGGLIGRGRWYARPTTYVGPAYDPMMFVWIIVAVLILLWVFGHTVFFR